MGGHWLALALLILPISSLGSYWGIGFFQAQAVAFILIGFACLLWLLPDWWLRGAGAWVFVSFLWSGARDWGFIGLIGVLTWMLFYREAERCGPAARQRVIHALTGAGLFQVAWMTMQAAGIDPIFREVTWRGDPYLGPAGSGLPPPVVGFFGNPMDAALFLGLSLPLVLSLHWGLGVLLSLALVKLQATVGIMSLVGGWLWWAGWRRLRVTLPLTVAALGVNFWYWDPQGFGSKLLIWKQAWRLALAEPVFGWGPNALDYRVTMFQPRGDLRWNFVFNEWLQGAMEVGLVGAGLALGFVGWLGWRLARGRRWVQAGPWLPAGVLALGSSVFSIPLRSAPAALLVAVILGVLAGAARAEGPA